MLFRSLKGETERRQETQHVGASAAREAVLLLDERHTHVLVRTAEVDAYHQSFATYVKYLLWAFCLEFPKLSHEVVAHRARVLHKVLVLHHIEHGKGSGTTEMVASEGGAELTVDGLKLRRDEHCTHRETVGYSFCHGDDVGTDTEPLMGEELTTTAITALYLIANKYLNDGLYNEVRHLKK